jgi:hypothetical protein
MTIIGLNNQPVTALPKQPRKKRIHERFTRLVTERSPWVAIWKQQADYILPRRFRDTALMRNKPAQNDKLINNTPTQAARTLASGLMSGLTSPARPWFRLAIPGAGRRNGNLSEDVKLWLNIVENVLREVLIRSNVYNALAHVYGDLGTYCTAGMIVEEDTDEVVRAYTLPLGSFVLMTSSRGQVNGVIREVPMTVAQVVEKFGAENCSKKVQEAAKRGQLDEVVEVVHCVEPNADYIPDSPAFQHMRWRSCWYEQKENIADDHFLGEGGFHEFPGMFPRWAVTGTDTYGTGPGFDALGDAKALQVLEKRKAMVVDRITMPPMVAPTSMKAGKVSLLPGDVTYVDRVSGGQGFEPAISINPAAIQAIDGIIRSHEDRINRAFYADLWLAMTMDERNQRATAREVAERHEEKLLALGPTLERLHDELLDKLIERVFGICMRRGLIPPPPQELQGADLKVEYISIMAAAQRLLGVSAVERLSSFVGNIAAANPEALDKVDFDEAIDQYADMLGVDPQIVRSDEDVARIRAQRAQAAAQKQQQELALQQGPAMAQSAKLLSETDVNGTSALNRLLQTTGGGGAPVRGADGRPLP